MGWQRVLGLVVAALVAIMVMLFLAYMFVVIVTGGGAPLSHTTPQHPTRDG